MGYLLEVFRLGLHNLRLHKLRSFLTSLGIILGVAAVIVMVSIGEGTKQAALRDIEALGATNVIVRSTRPPESSSMGNQERSFVASFGITREDLRRVRFFIDDATNIVATKSVGDEMSHASMRLVSQAYGVSPDLINVTNLHLARGRYISDQDIIDRTQVAVIGDQIERQFFPLVDPLGQNLRIGQRIFRIIGVLSPVGIASSGRDLNKDVHIPMTTAEIEFGDVVTRRESGNFSGEEVEITEIYVTAPSTEVVMQVADRVRRIIEVSHPDLKDVQVIVPWELLDNVKKTQLVWNVVLITIAAISLLVGGIGIMNIMLASVTERTREIGIRRALGATRKHIISQFLVETGSLSAVGGLLGIGFGVGASVALGQLIPWLLRQPFLADVVDTSVNFETDVTGWSIVASIVVAGAVGLVFGIYPALVASRQDPIVALRHD